MKFFLNIFMLVAGLIVLIKGADYFVSGASAVAKRLKVSSLMVGLTIVAVGTSLPELAISIASAIKGSVDMSVGNILGSNLSNMLLITGIVACIGPIAIAPSSKKFDFPFLIIVTGVLLLFSCDKLLVRDSDNTINRIESVILLGLLVFYLVKNIRDTKKIEPNYKEDKLESVSSGVSVTHDGIVTKQMTTKSASKNTPLKAWQIVLCLVFGLGAVVLGGECVSRSAQYLTIRLGMSESLVGLTIVAIGTSLPELVTAVVAAKKGETDLAIGNVVGSNIINICLVLGAVGVITQISISTTILTDLSILFVSTIIFSVLAFSKMKLSRSEGVLLVVMYVLYITFAIVRNYCF